MTVARGAFVGPYEIVSQIGCGGMGVVWRARDPRIRRDVAIKVLAGTFAPGDERLQRFEQEARAAGSLNHPGLVTIFDAGTTDGTPYIVMELLEGETLRDVIGETEPAALPLHKAVDYAIQIATALAAAHGHGIIHRDLKPENLFVTGDRRVKILDFGLAKLAPDWNEAHRRENTLRQLTGSGLVVGTPRYMSPEQVRAGPVDHRTDIFSLGSVIYEMLTGRPPFDRATAVETMHAVLEEEPPPLGAVPPALQDAVARCLEKDPRDRFQSASDLAYHLQSLPALQRSTSHNRHLRPRGLVRPRPRRRRTRAAIIALAVVLALAAGGFVWRGFHGAASSASPRTYRQLTSGDGIELFPTLAPDGKSFAFVSAISGNHDIYVQRTDGRTAIDITADSPDDDSEPAFSPDGSQIAFRSEREGGGIFLMGATGESPRRLTDFGHNPSWSPDGTRLVVASEEIGLLPYNRTRPSELWIVDARNGARRPLVQRKAGGPAFGNKNDAVQPSWSPHGKRIAYWGITSLSAQRDIWTIDPDAPNPEATAVRVTSDAALHWNPVWSPDGKYLYYGCDRDGTLNLWRIAMNEDSGAPAGAPEPVALPAPSAGYFAVSSSGELAYVTMGIIYRLMALPFDANAATLGEPRQVLAGSSEIYTFAPSPDGKTIAYTTGGMQEDVFVAEGTRVRQLTNDAARDRGVEWGADGKTLYFYSNRDGRYRVWSIRTDGSALTVVTTDADLQRIGARYVYWPVPSPDGKTLVVRTDRDTSALVHLDRPPGQRLEPIPTFLATASWSPDGQFLAGRDRDVKLHDLRGRVLCYSLQARRTDVVSENGSTPSWTPDGKKIVTFERQNLRIYDVGSHAATTMPFASIGGVPVEVTGTSARLSRDGATVYAVQTIQQGDIWLAPLPGE